MNQENMQDLEIFLGGTFHQDIDDPEEALLKYIHEVDIFWLKKIASIVKMFLETNLSEEEENAFIAENTEIYFPALDMSPVEWLKSVLDTIELYIDSIY